MTAVAAVLGTLIAASLSVAPAPPSCPIRPSLAVACTAAAPDPGQEISGPVLEVIDGRTLCVALGPTPDQWVRVRLADGAPDASRAALVAAVFARKLDCMAISPDADGARAVCLLGGRSAAFLAQPTLSPQAVN